MPKYRITSPDGRTFEITAPEGATKDQVLAYAQQNYTKQQQKPLKLDPTEGMTAGQKFLAGAGKAFSDIGMGVGERLGLVSPEEVKTARERDEPLMKTGWGTAGNILGNAAAYAPLAVMPGANTIAGGAAYGALIGAVQPTTEDESVGKNILLGGGAGAVVPAAVKTYRTVKAAVVDPFTEAGKTRIAGNVINQVASDPKEVMKRLAAAGGATPGFNPTVGQSSGDQGVSSLERTIRAINPGAFNEVDQGQRAALADALRNIAQNDVARQQALETRESAVKPLYDLAKKSIVEGDNDFKSLLQRPTIAEGVSQAQKIAADEGRTFMLSPAVKSTVSESPILSSSGAPFVSSVESAPATYSGQALHDIKMGIDKALTEGSQGIGNRIASSQNSAKQAYLDWLESKIPEYSQARQTYTEMSKPINQMDIGQEFTNRLIPSLYRDMPAPQQLNAAAYAKALRDQGDVIAKNVTGMKGATLEGTMTPEQMQTLQNVAKDLETMKVAENAGRGVGSDTIQKAAMSHIASQAGIPTWFSNLARVPGGWAKRAGDVLYGNADEQVRNKLAYFLANPQEAAKAMEAAGIEPSKKAEILRAITQSGALAIPQLQME